MAHDVFISYSRRDSAIVDRIEQELNRHGVTVFIDRSGIELGTDFAEIIGNAISSSQIILFVWSENSNQSKQAANEIVLALNNGKTIIPFKIGGFKPAPTLDYHLGRLNRIDVDRVSDAKIAELAEDIAQIVHRKHGCSAESTTYFGNNYGSSVYAPNKKMHRSIGSHMQLLTIIVCLVCLVGGGVFLG